LILTIAAVPAYSQGFEVSSVRPAQPGATVRDARISFRGDRFEAKAETVGAILDMLRGWQLYRVLGGPAWIDTDRYDIEAKADRELTGPEQEPAIMVLLAERFKLKSHKETREISAFVLRIPKMPAGLKRAGEKETYSVVNDARHDVVFTGFSMPSFTNYLSQMVHAPVVDETGLEGLYDFTLPVSQVSVQPRDSYGDLVREAAEALGFRIEEKKIPLEVTVIDRCERPSEN